MKSHLDIDTNPGSNKGKGEKGELILADSWHCDPAQAVKLTSQILKPQYIGAFSGKDKKTSVLHFMRHQSMSRNARS